MACWQQIMVARHGSVNAEKDATDANGFFEISFFVAAGAGKSPGAPTA